MAKKPTLRPCPRSLQGALQGEGEGEANEDAAPTRPLGDSPCDAGMRDGRRLPRTDEGPLKRRGKRVYLGFFEGDGLGLSELCRVLARPNRGPRKGEEDLTVALDPGPKQQVNPYFGATSRGDRRLQKRMGRVWR